MNPSKQYITLNYQYNVHCKSMLCAMNFQHLAIEYFLSFSSKFVQCCQMVLLLLLRSTLE